jgi:CubicO group peptidase (beta-lactamase class C family)
MERTVLEGADQDADDVASLHDASRDDYGCFFGAGGYVSTPSDLVRLGSAMLKPGLLTAETIALLSAVPEYGRRGPARAADSRGVRRHKP